MGEQQRFREAIESDHLDLVRDLLQENRSLQDEVRPGGYTALQHAARYGKVRIAQLLLQRGSNIGSVNPSGSALHAAWIGGHADMVQFLLSNSRCEEDVNSKNPCGKAPLLLIDLVGRDVTIDAQLAVLGRMLSDSRVFANSKDCDGRTLLSLIAARGSSDKAQVAKMSPATDGIVPQR